MKRTTPNFFALPKPHAEPRKHLIAAEGFFDLGMYAEAHEQLELADKDPDLRMAVAARQLDLYIAEERWEDAVILGEVLADLDPENGDYSLQWARALHAQGKSEAALEVLGEAFCELEHDPEYRYYTALYSAVVGQSRKALYNLGQAIAMDSDWLKVALTEPELKDLVEKLPPILREPVSRRPRSKGDSKGDSKGEDDESDIPF